MKRSSCASGRGYVPSCSIGFWVASTKKGDGKEWVWPAAVTWCSCIACSSAACVLGGVRFTSSASTMFANTGPRTKRKLRLPVLWSSSMISVPVISEGMRSGVNWMRENLRSSVCATVCTIRVLASPGTPKSSACPPENTAVRMPSSTSRWPTMRRPTWVSRSARARASRSSSSTSPDGGDEGRGTGDGLGGMVALRLAHHTPKRHIKLRACDFACEIFHKRVCSRPHHARRRAKSLRPELRRRLLLRRAGLQLRVRHPRVRRARLGGRRLARDAAAVRAGGRGGGRVRRVHEHLLPREARHRDRERGSGKGETVGVRPYLLLLVLGGMMVVVVAWLGGRPAGIGGAVALGAQLGAVALLRPAMRAAQPVFMARWLGGMGVRALALGVVLAIAATHRAALGPLPASLGFLGVLLPLLFLETRFLR